MRIKRLVEDITFHHVGPLGFHLLPGVPSSIITKIKAIWLSARHPPTLVVFQLPCMGNFTHESEERCQRASTISPTGLFFSWKSWAQRLACQGLFPNSNHCRLHSIRT